MTTKRQSAAKLPEWIRPFSSDEQDQEERRQNIVHRRMERLFGRGGLVDRYERTGDELIEFNTIAQMLAANIPGYTSEALVQRFIASVKLGAFPHPGVGFREYPDRRVVRDLVDLVNFNQFTRGQYPLRPSPLTVEMSPQAMRARRSVWVRWIAGRGWPVPPELAHGLMIDYELAPPDQRRLLDFDRPWWDIETLLKWIGEGEAAGLVEIEKHAEHLDLTGQLGPLYPGVGMLDPRKPIPKIEFADCVLRKFAGRYVYLCNPKTTPMEPVGWQHLRLRADNAKAVWQRKKASDRQPARHSRKRGPKNEVGQRVLADMLSDIKSGQLTREALDACGEEALAARYRASRDTVRKARNKVLSRASNN